MLLVVIAGCDANASDSQLRPAACDSCAIVLRRVTTLDFSDAPFMPSMFVSLEQLSDETFVVADFARGSTEILHFSKQGSFVDTHMREGPGPGEATEIRHLLAIGDSLLVIDSGSVRCTVLDAGFAYVRDFRCIGAPSDAELVAGRLFLTGFGPMGLVEVDPRNGERVPPRSDGERVPVSDDYSSMAAELDGVWFVEHPSEYRLTYWRSGDKNPSRTIERRPEWWQPGERFRVTEFGPGVRPPSQQAMEARQIMSGPVVFNIGVRDGFVWTASYVQTLTDRQYSDFLTDWLGQGLQGSVRVVLEVLTSEGQAVATNAFDSIAPPRFTTGGLMYTLDKVGDGTAITVYRPEVVAHGIDVN